MSEKYYKKTHPVNAFQWKGEVNDLIIKETTKYGDKFFFIGIKKNQRIPIEINDWILTNNNNILYPCKDKIFKQKFIK